MKKEVIVISLGGSLIVPDKIDIGFLKKFKKVLIKNTKNYKFVVVTGGGSTARKYINALRKEGKSKYLQSLMGISVTRLNARFVSYFFGKDPKKGIPYDMKHVKGLVSKNDIVFCGALRYAPKQTSDSTSAKLASYLGAKFVNLTNVKGLYSANPAKYKSAKFIPKISRVEMYKMMMKFKFKAGQHAPLDQTAVKVIKDHKIPVFLLGKNMKNFDNFLKGKKFIGTVID
jgi:uridylate kinase